MASTVAAELATLRPQGMELFAVASRNAEQARAFAARYGAVRSCADYSSLVNDPDVDLVYIATPHALHHQNMLACIRAGKSVLCEKPFTINASEAREVIEAARQRKVFVMEAMWTRFLPAVSALKELLAAGAVGRVNLIVGGGAFMPDRDSGHYLFDKALGGGALLDAGVYLISMASMILGSPIRCQAFGTLGSTGVDEQDAILLEHAGGAHALLYVSLRARRPPDLEILGDEGRIQVAAPIFRPAGLTIVAPDGRQSAQDHPIDGSGYAYQLREASAAHCEGRLESSRMPLDETLSVMQTMDTLRRQIGLRYANEPA